MLFTFVFLGVLVLFLGAYGVSGVHSRLSYRTAFEQTQIGDSLSDVVARFGAPGVIEGHQDAPGYDWGSRSVCGGSCWLRIGYELPFSLNAATLSIDFDRNQKVINKAELNSP